MSYEALLEQIKAAPEECLNEISNYISYVMYRYEKQKTVAERFDDECAKAQAWAKETGLGEQDILYALKEVRSANQFDRFLIQ